jgi:CHAD domain-containing protein
MLEEERKFDVDPEFTLPDLTGALPAGARVVPRPTVALRATYYDTGDLRLARAGASLRFRRGDQRPWTVKLPTRVPGVRHEISRTGRPDTIPGELAALVTVYTRGAPLSGGDTAVHQMRVGCRRLRSDLLTFRPLLDPVWADRLRAELSWIAGALGGARDVEVLRARLRRTAAADPLSPLDPDAIARFDAELEARHSAALAALAEAMTGKRYLALLDRLVDAAAAPRLAGDAGDAARHVLPRLALKPWRRLADGSPGALAAGALDPLGPDREWHDVRIRAKRARYATEAAAAVLGGKAAKLARRIGEVQELLGEHQDAVIAADTWLSIAGAAPDDHSLAVTAGRLVERERAAIRAVRATFPAAWAAVSRLEPREWSR